MRVGFDIGGTFTDLIIRHDDGRIFTRKVLSVLDRVGDDVAGAVRPLAGRNKIENFVHGTTVASNAIIEGTTARTALITTHGFRDELEMRGQRRPNIYDVNWERLPALIPRSLRFEVKERVLGNGSIEQPLDLEQARSTIQKLIAEQVEAIAVCLINSYLNPIHERQLARLLTELAPRTVVCLSSDIHPEIKEYDRASTTAINASLIPVIDRYFNRLKESLSPLCGRILVMQSNGGIMSAEAARRRPAYIIESGPAAGVLAAARLAAECELDKVLSFDMGGTTVKACLIEEGKPLEKPGGEIGAGVNATRLFGGGGHVVRVPSIDIVEAGAGGGSIAWLDDSGALRVGPRSAGAQPGPVCYGQGGAEPTVTDANVVLGYMSPNAIAGSTLQIRRDAAVAAIESKLALPLGLNLLEVAYGITQVANSAMTRVLRAVSTERGRDPREFTLLAFGGAGPIHAAALAENMGISRVLVPLYPGLFSALGLLLADYRHDYIAAIAAPVTSIRPEEITDGYEQLKARARAEMIAEGVDANAIRFEQQVDLKYGYQMYEMTLPFPAEVDSANLAAALSRLFTDAHNQAYGYYRDDPIQLVSIRLRALASASLLDFAELASRYSKNGASTASPSRFPHGQHGSTHSERPVFFGPVHGLVTTQLRSRDSLNGIEHGPIIFEEPDTTVVVPPNWTVGGDRFGNLVLAKM
ncbi:MAG: hydantoinase/oxoprolinase family protein [Deltaproteobacteria bacterium]|nr:hydantoinase/oxoprolinase family protein [Deltaproteobacteria bacterium]